MRSKYVLRPSDVPGYSPANHRGTTNRRLVAPEVNGSQFMEIIHGEISREGGFTPHAHPAMEQAAYLIEGEAIITIDGASHRASAGDLMFFPAGAFHAIEIVSERIKVLVIYSPPYGEDPENVIRSTEGKVEVV